MNLPNVLCSMRTLNSVVGMQTILQTLWSLGIVWPTVLSRVSSLELQRPISYIYRLVLSQGFDRRAPERFLCSASFSPIFCHTNSSHLHLLKSWPLWRLLACLYFHPLLQPENYPQFHIAHFVSFLSGIMVLAAYYPCLKMVSLPIPYFANLWC